MRIKVIIEEFEDNPEGGIRTKSRRINPNKFVKFLCWLFEKVHHRHFYIKGKKYYDTIQIRGWRTALLERCGGGQRVVSSFMYKIGNKHY